MSERIIYSIQHREQQKILGDLEQGHDMSCPTAGPS